AAIRTLLEARPVARRSLVWPIVAIAAAVLCIGGCLVGGIVLPAVRSLQVARERAARHAAEPARAPEPPAARETEPAPAPAPAVAPRPAPAPAPAVVFARKP